MKIHLGLAAIFFLSATVEAAPFRYAKMTAIVNRQFIDLSGPEPVMKIEEICQGELEIPVLDFINEPDEGSFPEPTEFHCPTSYERKPGTLNVGASVHLRNDAEKGALKAIVGWIYFLPTDFKAVDPVDLATLPSHTASVATNAIDLEYIQMSLWTGGPQVCAYREGKPVCMLGNTFLVSIEINDHVALPIR